METEKACLDHVTDMLQGCIYHKKLPFRSVLMDSWYATNDLCNISINWANITTVLNQKNRLVADTECRKNYKSIESLNWTKVELEQGKIIKVKTFPQDKKVKLFRVTVSTDRMEYIATNDLTQNSIDAILSCV
jgi:hypothetical protein